MKWLIGILVMMVFHSKAQIYQPVQSLKVYAGPDQEIILPDNEVELVAEVSTDMANNWKVKWSKISGPEAFKISSPKRGKTKISNLVEGEYQFLLEAVVREKAVGWDTVKVSVIKGKENQVPILDAGPDQTITFPTSTVVLSGSASDPDPGGFIEMYRWSSVSGPSDVQFETPTKPQTRVSNLIEGEYRFGLIVSDNNGASNQDYVTIKVIRPKNKPPIANTEDQITITLPTNSVTLTGEGSDPEGASVKFLWTKSSGTGQYRIVSPTRAQTRVTNLGEGVYNFTLTVTDTLGLEDQDRVIVLVLPPLSKPYNPPIANAGDDIAITLPKNSVILSGSGTHPDTNGQITKYEWKQISGPSPSTIVNSNLAITEVINLDTGEYKFELIVTDNKGLTAEDDISVTVIAKITIPDNKPPVVNAGSDQTFTFSNNTITLSGSAMDPDSNGFIARYQWTETSGSSDFRIVSSTDSNKTIKIEILKSGRFQFALEATDNKGATGVDSVNIIAGGEASTPWPLIIGIGLGLTALASSWFFFFWIPTAKKVIVFFMHKDEEILAKALMPGSKATEGYTVGECSPRNLKKMKDKGLAIHILNPEMLVINTPGKTRTRSYSIKKGERKMKSEVIDMRPGVNIKNLISDKQAQALADVFPAFYIITLDMPLIPEFEAKLKGIGLHIIQHVPYNSYILYIENPGQLASLNSGSFDFIRLINQYSPSDTGLMVREDHFQEAVNTDSQLVLDVFLHRAEDSAEVYAFFEQLKINIIGSYKNRIRISVPARSMLSYNLAGNKYIQAIYEYIPPTLNNDIARHLVRVDSEAPGKMVIAETGLGEIIGIADTGIDIEHPDLKSHIVGVVAWGRKATNDTSDPHGHGTHVAGSIVGDGTASDGQIKGIAPGARIFFQSLMDDAGALSNFDLKLQELFNEAYTKGARIHNNSWGSAAEARYTIDSNIVDEFIYNHPEMLIVISAGNEGVCDSQEESEKGYVGFGSVGSPATTKNGLTVGASRNKRTTGGYASATYGKIWPDKYKNPPTSTELISGDDESIAAFSSRGRCDDFRMKPDIVAPGTDILSTKSSLASLNAFHGGYVNEAYAFLSGTSMSAPIVSGAAAIVREFYKSKKAFATPSAALIKATLINGTRKLKGMSAIFKGDRIPNPNQGYGMLDLSMTIPNAQNNFHLEFRDSLQDPAVSVNITGQEYAVRFRTQQVTWIRACLAYTDYPARAIQNNLDLLMDFEPTREKWSGNLGINADDPYSKKKEDNTNNMEIIRIETAQPGLYTIKVFARNLPKGKQDFALVITTGDMNVKFEK